MSASDTPDALETAALDAWLRKVLQKFGMFAVDASAVVDRLIESEGRGRAGLATIADLVTAFDMGDIDPRARTLTTLDLPSFATLDGSTGVGEVAASKAMQLAIDKARLTGLACVTVSNSQPCADLATITELAAAAGCLGFCTSNFGKAQWPAAAEAPWLAAHPQVWSFPGEAGTCWTATRTLTADDFPSDLAAWHGVWHAVISQALTAGLTGGRVPAQKKKASPYGSGAEHTCLAIDLTVLSATPAFGRWVADACPRTDGLWQPVSLAPRGAHLRPSPETWEQLQSAAQSVRIPLPAAPNN